MRILIYRLGSLGDTVVALPCFHLVRKSHQKAHITVLTNSPVSGKAAALELILQNSGLIDQAVHYPIGLRNPVKLALLRAKLCAERFDVAISLTAARGWLTSIRDYLFFKACGIPKVIGVPFDRRDLICQPNGSGSDFEPEAERLIRRVKSIGSIDHHDPESYNLSLTTTEINEAKQLLDESNIQGKFIVVSLGTKLLVNDWGNERWGELLTKLSLTFPELPLVIIGSSDEAERSALLLSSWKGPHANMCGKTSPRVSAALLREALLFVGHDSGPMHLAAAVGTRCVTIYSSLNPPGQWFPFGKGHINLYPYSSFHSFHANAPQDQAIASIRVEDVLSAVQSCLS